MVFGPSADLLEKEHDEFQRDAKRKGTVLSIISAKTDSFHISIVRCRKVMTTCIAVALFFTTAFWYFGI
jgi:hypothetical protein